MNAEHNWTAEHRSFVQANIDDGKSQAAIAVMMLDVFGVTVTRGAIAGQITRGHVTRPPAYSMETRKRNVVARKLARAERVAARIARGELVAQQKRDRREFFKMNPGERFAAARDRGTARSAGMFIPAIFKASAAEPITEEGKTFAGLGEQDCRWWVGNDADGAMRFCGCQIHRPRLAFAPMYCDQHAMAATRTVNPEQERAEYAAAMAVS